MKYTYEVITNTNCNLECYFCFAKDKSHSDYLSVPDFKKGLKLVMKKMDDDGLEDRELFIKIYGGEPLLNSKKIIEYLEEVKKDVGSGIKSSVAIITNGTVLTDEFIQYFKKNCDEMNLGLTFSFEINEEYQDKIRHFKGGDVGSYDVFVKNTNKYREVVGYNPIIQTVISPEFIYNIDLYIEFMEKNKDKYKFGLVPMFDSTFDDFNFEKIGNLKRLFDYFLERVKAKDDRHIMLFQPFRSCMALSNIGETSSCLAGVTSFAITPNGYVYPCSRMLHNNQEFLNYGHVDSDKTYENMKNFETFMSSHVKLDGGCTQCQTKNDIGCIGQCISEKLLNGNLENITNVCLFNIEFGKLSRNLYESLSKEEFEKHISYANNEGYKKTIRDKFFDIEKNGGE